MKQKIIITIVALTMIFSPIAQPTPVAYANFPVIDFTQVLQFIWGEVIRPALIETLKKQVLDRFIGQILTYVQGGGKPQFVTNWQGFLTDAADGAGGQYVQNLAGGSFGFLCSPFSLQLQVALFPVRDYSNQFQCTLSQIAGNIQAFYGDFRNGGWIAYGSSWQPQNNFLGSLLTASEQLGIAKSNSAFSSWSEALSGRGFLGGKDANGNIKTPGSTIGDLTAKALGTGIDGVLSAQDIGSYAADLVNALLNRALSEGLSAVQPPSSSQSSVDAANAAYENSVITQSFGAQRSAVLAVISGTRDPRVQAQNLIDSTIANLNTFKVNIAKISDDLTATGRSSCAGGIVVSAVQAQITSDLALADSEIAQLQSASADNKTTLDPLDSAVIEINQMSPSRANLNRLDAINSEISQVIDDTAAADFLSGAQTSTASINNDITEKTAAYNQQLYQCQH